MARIWLVNPFDPVPGDPIRPGRYAWICEHLAAAGHTVTWWSSDFLHALKRRRGRGWEERRPGPGVRIVLVPTPPYATNISLRRLYSHFVFARQLPRAFAAAPAPDAIITSFPPVGTSRSAIAFGCAHGIPVVIDIQDLWPEAFELASPGALRPAVRVGLRILGAWTRAVYAGAAGVVAVSRTYAEHALRRSGRPTPFLVLPLGIDVTAFDADADGAGADAPRYPWITHVGTVGRAYDLDALLDAAALERRAGSPSVFRVIGDGPELPRLRRAAARRGLENVTFDGRLPFTAMASVLRRSMVGLHAIPPGSPPRLMNKLFDYLAAGLPVVNSSPGDAADLLRAEDIGVTYRPGDGRDLAEGVRALVRDRGRWQAMSERARDLAVERFDRRTLYAKLEPFVEAVRHSGLPRVVGRVGSAASE